MLRAASHARQRWLSQARPSAQLVKAGYSSKETISGATATTSAPSRKSEVSSAGVQSPAGTPGTQQQEVSPQDVEEVNQELQSFFGARWSVSSGDGHKDHVNGPRQPPPSPADLPSASSAPRLTHVDGAGRAAMVDVGAKPPTPRHAAASGAVLLGPHAFKLVAANAIGKGDVLTVAKVAGIMGAKHTSTLIPLCHNIRLSSVDVKLKLVPERHAVAIEATAHTVGRTGVEMEALTAVTVAALTVYDMCKAVSRDIVIAKIWLKAKWGGQSGPYARTQEQDVSVEPVDADAPG